MTEIERREFLRESLKSTSAAIAGVGMLTGTSCSLRRTTTDSLQHVTTEIRNPTREELVKRLEELAENEPKIRSSMAAMCYATPNPSSYLRVAIPCPDCKKEGLLLTLYSNDFAEKASQEKFGKQFHEQFPPNPDFYDEVTRKELLIKLR